MSCVSRLGSQRDRLVPIASSPVHCTADKRTAEVVRIVDPRPLFRLGMAATLADAFPDCEIEQSSLLDSTAFADGTVVIFTESSLASAEAAGQCSKILSRQAAGTLSVVIRETTQFAARFPLLSAMPGVSSACDEAHFIQTVASILAPGTTETSAIQKIEPRSPSDGIRTLTVMQFRVLELIGQGLLNKQIAYRCSISEATVKSHASEVFRKLGIRRRSEAAVIFTRMLFGRSMEQPDRYRPAA